MANWGHGEGLDVGVYLQWFEAWIKGRDTGIRQTERPMHLFEMGTQRWTNLARYPVVDRYTRWVLRPGGALAAAADKRQGDDALAWALPDEANGRTPELRDARLRPGRHAGRADQRDRLRQLEQHRPGGACEAGRPPAA